MQVNQKDLGVKMDKVREIQGHISQMHGNGRSHRSSEDRIETEFVHV